MAHRKSCLECARLTEQYRWVLHVVSKLTFSRVRISPCLHLGATVSTSQGTERIQQLQERVVEIKAAIQDSVSRADEHRQNLMRGDEIVAQRLHAMERRLRDEKAMRNLRREVRRQLRTPSRKRAHDVGVHLNFVFSAASRNFALSMT